MDVNITRTEEEKKYGLLAKKVETFYKATVKISLDDEVAQELEKFLKEKENNSVLVYELIGRDHRKGYIMAPPDQPNVMNNPYNSGSRYVESSYGALLNNHKEGKKTELSCVALSMIDREDWIKKITDELKFMKENSIAYNIIADRPTDETVSI